MRFFNTDPTNLIIKRFDGFILVSVQKQDPDRLVKDKNDHKKNKTLIE
jgi:hypothetical protein